MPRSLFQIIDNLKINHITAVPTIYVLMLQSYNKNQYDLSSLSCCITGGAYMSLEMIERIKSEMSIELYKKMGMASVDSVLNYEFDPLINDSEKLKAIFKYTKQNL